VVVVGGGISGLAAAWELSGGSRGTGGGPGIHHTGTRGGTPELDADEVDAKEMDGREVDGPEIIVLESTSRLGGPLDSVKFGDHIVDTGPDGFLGRRPEAVALCHEIGLESSLVPIARSGAAVWARGRLRPLPASLALGIPTRFGPTARSGILGLRGQIALARDVVLPRPDVRGPIGDRSIGPLVSRKLGRRVSERLADPLIGGIHAGSVDDMSAAATFPPLLAAAQKRGSLMRALRAEMPTPAADPPPLFWALEGGMASLITHLAAALRARGVEIRCNTPVEQLERPGERQGQPQGERWSVAAGAEHIRADAVVLALPAPGAGRLLAPHDDEAAALLANIPYASVTVVTMRVPVDAVPGPLTGTGFLVPRQSPPARGRDAWAVTGCTYLSEKWPHLSTEGEVLLRASLGRFGDDRADSWSDAEVIARVWDELGLLLGLTGEPLESMVTRWRGAFPQYRVHHLMRTAGIEAALARLGGIASAGAAYRGVGIPACIASGRAAAQALA